MSNIEENYFNSMNISKQSDEGIVFKLKNESGEGTITSYDVFPGVTLSYNDFHMHYYESDYVTKRNVLCVDHCREGRLEYQSHEDAYSYVGAGDLKIDRRLTHEGLFVMPLSHYHGVMISFDLDVVCESLPREIKDFPVDISALQQKYCPEKYPVVLHEPSSIEHICGELYLVPENIRKPYYKIKVLELLLYLQALELPKDPQKPPYFYKIQVEKVKAIAKLLSDNIDKSYNQEELSKQFDISLTAMKRCFSSVFGSPIGAWLTEYRMNMAAEMLRENKNKSITEIAANVGYESPSKFAIAFRKVMNLSPVEYRNQ